MTTPDPLWSDERINELIASVLMDEPNHTPRGLARRVAFAIRDEYEAHIATVRENDELAAMFQYLAAGKLDEVRLAVHDYVAKRLLAGSPGEDAP